MEWKFVLLRQMQLRLIGLLPIAIGCQRDAPRHEPGPIAPTENRRLSSKPQDNIKGPMQSISNGNRLFPDFSNNIDQPLAFLLKDIGWSDLLPSQFRNSTKPTILRMAPPAGVYAQNDFSSFIESYLLNGAQTTGSVVWHGLSSRLVVVFDNNQQHNSCDKRRLVGTESITLRSNPDNSEKHTYALIGFLVHRPKHSEVSKEHFVPFVQSGKKWYFDNKHSRKLIDTQKAIQLASERGTIFFYKKII